jgi:hypothetical protein
MDPPRLPSLDFDLFIAPAAALTLERFDPADRSHARTIVRRASGWNSLFARRRLF